MDGIENLGESFSDWWTGITKYWGPSQYAFEKQGSKLGHQVQTQIRETG